MRISQFYQAVLILTVMSIASCQSTKYSFSKKDVKSAQKIIGIELSDQNIDTLYGYLNRNKTGFDTLRSYTIDNGVMPAILFDPIPSKFEWPVVESCTYIPNIKTEVPSRDADIAFLTVAEQASLIKSGKLTSERLTRIYLERIKKYDPTLKAVITLIEEEAILKAKDADAEIQAGKYKGPLHGIPYGVKDLVSVKGYPTTWGAMPYKDQVIDYTAEIVNRLEEAGAILIAKLTSGALARGDVWWGGKTVSPWDTLQGASGSSAGSGSATAAGLVGFSIGTETLGSITSPSTRNGITGLRPTYGRVSRDGVMPLSWSMDKVGPICRSAEDCLLVFQVIQGKDERDPTLYDLPFCYKDDLKIEDLKVGVFQNLVDKDTSENAASLRKAIQNFKGMGLTLIEDSLPKSIPYAAFDIILRAEAGAFFDDLVRSGKTDIMVEQGPRSRANSLRQARFIPAVEYIQANRHRKVLIEEMHEIFSKYDVIITPTFGWPQLLITNLTGHPVVTVPISPNEEGRPMSISILGGLFDEAKILKLAKAFQNTYDYENHNPPLFEGRINPISVTRIPAHAHNDYESERPLFGALHKGCAIVEVDVHLINNELYVSHNKPKDLKPGKTLQKMYLDPLQFELLTDEKVIYNDPERPIYLMIDVKSEASSSYMKLKEVLVNYSDLLTGKNPPVKILISGNRAIDAIAKDSDEVMAIDGRPEDLKLGLSPEIMPLVSQRYSKYVSWKGGGEVPESDLTKLRALVKDVHDQGKKLRLWASPDDPKVWEFLLNNGVDIINVDDVAAFRKWYISRS